jgi:hypothetical protein
MIGNVPWCRTRGEGAAPRRVAGTGICPSRAEITPFRQHFATTFRNYNEIWQVISARGPRFACRTRGNLAKARIIALIAGSLGALATGALSAGAARAQDHEAPASAAPATDTNCLAAPTGKAPAGSHWRYRTDPATQTKCWHLKSDNEAAQKPAAADKSQAAATVASPPSAATGDAAEAPGTAAPAESSPPPKAARPPHKPHAAGQQASHGSPKAASKPDSKTELPSNANRQAGATAAAAPAPWPDSQPQATSGGFAWPDPSKITAAPAAAAAPQADTAKPNGEPEQPAAVPAPDDSSANSGPAATQSDAPVAATPAERDLPIGILLALVASMLIAGILLRRIVTTLFARRPKIEIERREPAWAAQDTAAPNIAARREAAASPIHHLDDEIKESLRKLLRTLERQAAA